MKLFKTINQKLLWLGLILLIIAIAAIPQAYNMFNFPYYENDEGVYMSQAWSVITQGKLAPYTYWYDHAPAGWLFISLWTILTGGFFQFGFSINSGRVFMLVLHVLSSFLLFILTKKITKSNFLGLISVVLFSLTPLGIYFQRRVLLDNIMVFWLLVSIVSLLYNQNKLRYIVLSGVAFGLSILSKETAVFYAPVMLYFLYSKTNRKHWTFGTLVWLLSSGTLVMMYFAYALIKGEFFPYGSPWGGPTEHVSLLESLQFQAGREGGFFLNPSSDFMGVFWVWYEGDKYLLITGLISVVINLIFSLISKSARLATILTLPILIYLIRGGIVLEFYVIPLIPFFALSIAISLKLLFQLVEMVPFKWIHFPAKMIMSMPIGIFLLGAVIESNNIRGGFNLYSSNQTQPQIEAVDWILNQESTDYGYIIDNYAYIELNTASNKVEHQFAEWYWKVDGDAEIQRKVVANNKSKIDYMAITPQMENDISSNYFPTLVKTIDNSRPITRFWNDGWGVTLWASQSPDRILSANWHSFKKGFIDKGRTFDPEADFETSSQAQAMTMLQAVWMNDQQTFEELWLWTKDYLQQDNGLFIWQDPSSDQANQLGTASVVDQDIALALIFASQVWIQPEYLNDAKQILNSLWELEVYYDGEVAIVMAGNWANLGNNLIVNPSYLSPASYRIFAQVDLEHDWELAAQTSYQLLELCTFDSLDKRIGVLPSHWCQYSLATNSVSPVTSDYPSSTIYSQQATQVNWRVALDYYWFDSKPAFEYLDSLNFLEDTWNQAQVLKVSYQHNGKVWDDYESVASYATNLAKFRVTDPRLADEIYQIKVLPKFYEENRLSYWEDPNNLNTQIWSWLGLGLYSQNLPNLYQVPEPSIN